MFELHIQAHTPRGIFQGQVTREPVEDREALERICNQMQSNDLTKVVLHDLTAWGTWREITLREDVLKESVLTYEIRRADVRPPSQNG